MQGGGRKGGKKCLPDNLHEQLCISGGRRRRVGGRRGGERGRLAVLGRGERSKCIAEGEEEEEEGLQLLFMSSREQRAHLGPYVNPQQASAH